MVSRRFLFASGSTARPLTSVFLGFPHKNQDFAEVSMKTVNLRDFYQSIYDHDCLYEVPDEVAELLILYKRREEAHRRLTYKYRAYFSRLL